VGYSRFEMCIRWASLIVQHFNKPPDTITAPELDAAAGQIIKQHLNNAKRSMLNNGRGHRTKDKEFDPAGNAVRMFVMARDLLLKHRRLDATGLLSRRDIWNRMQGLLDVDMCLSKRASVNDRLSPTEMRDAILYYPKGSRERLLVMLVCMMGMRIGAVAKLQLAGVVAGFNNLRPGMEVWEIMDTISGFDKGHRVNQWFLNTYPGLKVALHAFINEKWRPVLEHWITDTKGGMRLAELRLFPPQQSTTGRTFITSDSGRLSLVIKGAFNHAGVSKERMHAHAARKGFGTMMLERGFPTKVVSHLLHHQSTDTTEKFYDMRMADDILRGIVVPDMLDQPETISSSGSASSTPSPSPDAETDAASNEASTMDTDDDRRLRMLEALCQAVDDKKKMAQEIADLRSLLTPAQLNDHDARRGSEARLEH
jgi:hypothetical protein